MQIDFKLTWQKTVVSGGINFYYFQSLLLPSDWKVELLVNFLSLSIDVTTLKGFMGIYGEFPALIEEDTYCYSISGVSWQAPADLYLLLIRDEPGSPVILPGISDMFIKAPVAVYAEFPASEALAEDLPTDVSPDTYPPNDEAHPCYRLPTGTWNLASSTVEVVDQGYQWGRFGWFETCFGDCGLSLPADSNHIWFNTDSFSFYSLRATPSAPVDPLWRNDGSTRNADSCHEDTTRHGVYIHIDVGELLVDYYMAPTAKSNPVVWYDPDLIGVTLTPHAFGVPVIPIILQLLPALKSLMMGSHWVVNTSFVTVPKLLPSDKYGVASDDLPFACDALALVIRL